MILVFINLALFLTSIAFCVVFLFSNEKYYSIPIIVIAMILYILLEFFFSKYTKKYVKRQKNVSLKNFINCNGEKTLYKVEIKNDILLDNNGNEILNLSGYLFKNTFVKTLIIRLIRFSFSKIPCNFEKITKKKILCKNKKIVLRIRNDGKVHEYLIVNNFVSKLRFLEKKIIEAPYFIYKLHPWSNKYLNRMIFKNEEEYRKHFNG